MAIPVVAPARPTYERFYGLSERPFELTADPKYLFLTKRQREALSNLQYGLLSARSLTLLIGEAGTGKTTLLRAALESERCRQVHCIYLNNPVGRTDDFMRLLALKFDLGPESGESKPLLLERLERLLRERHACGEITALVIDEAQSLSVDLLEEIRLLANIETHSTKLLPLILAGQPRVGSTARRAEPSATEAARGAAMRARALRPGRDGRLHCEPDSEVWRRALEPIQPGGRYAHSSIFGWHSEDGQRDLRQRPD